MERLELAPTTGWFGAVRTLLTYGLDAGDTNTLVQVAGMVKTVLLSRGPEVYADWLQQDIGDLTADRRDVATALTRLPFPLLTTNYDTLLEKVSGRGATSWTNPRAFHELLVGRSASIGHLHGLWNEPESVVLSEDDYSRQGQAEVVQALERAISSVKTIIYVGFGSGLTDPNFSRLLDWHRRTFESSTVKHIRLCLESELDQLERHHLVDRIEPIAYGDAHDALAPFLSELYQPADVLPRTEAGIARDAAAETREAFLAQMHADSIITEAVIPGVKVESTILPPVILPVPHAEFAKNRSRGPRRAPRFERCDPTAEIGKGGLVLLVGEDESGLTTAVRWLTWKASVDRGVTPLYVNFRESKQGRQPLLSRITLEAREAGVIEGRRDPLPEIILGLDDLSPFSAHSDAVFDDLASFKLNFGVLGCKQGSEDEIRQALLERGVEVNTLFLGRVASVDINLLAKAVAPHRAPDLVKQVVEILIAASLPRTPLTISLLMLILVRGGSIRPSATQTQILEQYVAELLGRGDPLEDARQAVDPADREVALAHLAQFFVENRTSRVLESEVIHVFEDVFEKFAWTESPGELLSSLRTRRVLRRTGTHIEFSQSYYLYLFAAKRAIANADFRKQLVEKPLYFAPILTAYAALSREDRELLEHLRARFDAGRISVLKASPYAEVDLQEPEEIDAVASVEGSDDERERSSSDASTEGAEPARREMDVLDMPEREARIDLFVEEKDLPDSLTYWRNLELLSSVLRDSDHIEDLDLKRQTLVESLQGWGELVSVLTADQTFTEAVISIIDKLAESIGTTVDEDIRETLPRVLPAIMAMGGISESLRTRKLIKVLGLALDKGEIAGEEGAVGASMLLIQLREKGWPGKVHDLLKDRLKLWITQDFLLPVLADAYVEHDFGYTDDGVLLDLCIEIYGAGFKYATPARRGYHTSQFREILQKQRTLRRTKTATVIQTNSMRELKA